MAKSGGDEDFFESGGSGGIASGMYFRASRRGDHSETSASAFSSWHSGLVAAEAALKDRAFVRRAVREIRQGRAILERGLSRLGVRVFPSAANFVLVDFGARGPAITDALERRGILVRDQASSFKRPGFVRTTVGTAKQMQRFLSVLEGLL